MTIHDYHMTMKTTVRIAELKSRLSEYLRRVRRGQSITVLDRDTPVARLEPVGADASRLVVREPAPGSPRPRDVRVPPALRIKSDVLRLLADERGER
jgi:prevent-host-death family protein